MIKNFNIQTIQINEYTLTKNYKDLTMLFIEQIYTFEGFIGC